MVHLPVLRRSAAGRIKTLCRQARKPFVPLRSASIASFIAAIAAPPIEVEDS